MGPGRLDILGAICGEELTSDPRLRAVDADGLLRGVEAEVDFQRRASSMQAALLAAQQQAVLRVPNDHASQASTHALVFQQINGRSRPIIVSRPDAAIPVVQQPLATMLKPTSSQQSPPTAAQPQPARQPTPEPGKPDSKKLDCKKGDDLRSPTGRLSEAKGAVPVLAPPPAKPQAKPLIPGGPCENPFCGVNEAPQWRRIEKKLVCNRCGMYYHRHSRFPDWSYFSGIASKNASRSVVITHRRPDQPTLSAPPSASHAGAPLQAAAAGLQHPNPAAKAAATNPMLGLATSAVAGSSLLEFLKQPGRLDPETLQRVLTTPANSLDGVTVRRLQAVLEHWCDLQEQQQAGGGPAHAGAGGSRSAPPPSVAVPAPPASPLRGRSPDSPASDSTFAPVSAAGGGGGGARDGESGGELREPAAARQAKPKPSGSGQTALLVGRASPTHTPPASCVNLDSDTEPPARPQQKAAALLAPIEEEDSRRARPPVAPRQGSPRAEGSRRGRPEELAVLEEQPAVKRARGAATIEDLGLGAGLGLGLGLGGPGPDVEDPVVAVARQRLASLPPSGPARQAALAAAVQDISALRQAQEFMVQQQVKQLAARRLREAAVTLAPPAVTVATTAGAGAGGAQGQAPRPGGSLMETIAAAAAAQQQRLQADGQGAGAGSGGGKGKGRLMGEELPLPPQQRPQGKSRVPAMVEGLLEPRPGVGGLGAGLGLGGGMSAVGGLVMRDLQQRALLAQHHHQQQHAAAAAYDNVYEIQPYGVQPSQQGGGGAGGRGGQVMDEILARLLSRSAGAGGAAAHMEGAAGAAAVHASANGLRLASQGLGGGNGSVVLDLGKPSAGLAF
ncbi:hypothetical protein HYH03_016152 [Edaphochlamys debaryana]|uniref:GATA-type domain-containing protein n=1 Tax=Edaphochlamys debaryana TaxID=47281 RepID=A0A835XKC1_9CHLO|nr:hypothetical protein HYH03_016152 [Edaphochlamys debaryana]|eukprot:KAG2485054.1 hypothetical protein HYH03_016152 [Edaphochlamys debaryana]